ncbi:MULTISPECIES: PAS domain-containing sensor histidine kinase [unclassified Pseudoalteromonas]|uniref:sensor histidine kinase n=1 Tax=unclassified Pseudoalteromonas TaxID=194690 RepID=UPI0005A6C4AD|nr:MULTISPECIES: ATP-binding protein [unclassified Pseudoalteromonas]
MKSNLVSYYLITAILTLALLPFLASYLLLNEILDSATSLVVKPSTIQMLKNYQQDLKTLRKLNPKETDNYKEKFNTVSEQLLIFQQPDLVKKVISDTYLTYYLILFVTVLIFSTIAAIFLSRKVAKSYRLMVSSNITKEKKIQALSYFDEWQIIAGKLAHEINNPLTPIQMMVSNLSRLHQKLDRNSFAENLNNTENVVSEEVNKLKNMVSHFNKFSKLPEPDFQCLDILSHLDQFIQQYSPAWQSVNFNMKVADNIEQSRGVLIDADVILFNQCLLNLVNNAIQANPNCQPLDVTFSVAIKKMVNQHHWLKLTVFNRGKLINEKERDSIFKLYYSSKKSTDSSENMGLGLAIVRKIILDHKGDIQCLACSDGAAFELLLPLLSSKT